MVYREGLFANHRPRTAAHNFSGSRFEDQILADTRYQQRNDPGKNKPMGLEAN